MATPHHSRATRSVLPTLVIVAALAVLVALTVGFTIAAWWAGAGAFAWTPTLVAVILARRVFTEVLGGWERD